MVGKSLATPFDNDPTGVRLEFQRENTVVSCDFRVSDSYDPIREAQSWTRIAPRHFYGVDIALDAREYPCLNEPAHYVVTAVYQSRGGTVPANKEWKIPPVAVWEGTLRSRPVSFDLLRGR